LDKLIDLLKVSTTRIQDLEHTITIKRMLSKKVQIRLSIGLIEESQRKDIKITDNNGTNGIKISSIPSIPKKSATRVYE